jgi:hypothetical protein
MLAGDTVIGGWSSFVLERFKVSMHAKERMAATHEPLVEQPRITRIYADNESTPIRAHPSHPRFKGSLRLR